jgi:hypothetical protein
MDVQVNVLLLSCRLLFISRALLNTTIVLQMTVRNGTCPLGPSTRNATGMSTQTWHHHQFTDNTPIGRGASRSRSRSVKVKICTAMQVVMRGSSELHIDAETNAACNMGYMSG